MGKAKAARAAFDNARAEAHPSGTRDQHASKEHDHAQHAAKGEAHAQAKEAPGRGGCEGTATASHILFKYLGATARRARRSARKSRRKTGRANRQEGAEARAEFAELADKYTEDPSGKSNGGRLGTFPRARWCPEFDKATFALTPGSVSDVVESPVRFPHHLPREVRHREYLERWALLTPRSMRALGHHAGEPVPLHIRWTSRARSGRSTACRASALATPPPICQPDDEGYVRMQRLPTEPHVSIDGYLGFAYAENCGAAFGMLRTAPSWLRAAIFGVAGVGACIVLTLMFMRGTGGKLFAGASRSCCPGPSATSPIACDTASWWTSFDSTSANNW